MKESVASIIVDVNSKLKNSKKTIMAKTEIRKQSCEGCLLNDPSFKCHDFHAENGLDLNLPCCIYGLIYVDSVSTSAFNAAMAELIALKAENCVDPKDFYKQAHGILAKHKIIGGDILYDYGEIIGTYKDTPEYLECKKVILEKMASWPRG